MGAAQVLVVGAGPTGLTLALQAHAFGASVRIIERRSEAFRPSRALIVHPRTLEVLRPLGVTQALLERADVAPEGHLHVGKRVVRVKLDKFALPDTAFPHLTLVRQMDVEAVLAQALAEQGIAVERSTELVEVRDGTDAAHATLRSPHGREDIACDFVAGCDGPESLVRRAAGIGWHGGGYAQEVVLADLELDADLARGVAHVVAGRSGLLFLFALGERATWRLLATQPAAPDRPPYGQPGPSVPVAHLQKLLHDAGLNARIVELIWSARYPLQHRLASRFRQGRLFLAGDAAHAYSPATGQGMNTGIQDAANLGWKLAFASHAMDGAALLDSYDRERRPVAYYVLAMTRLAFWGEAATGLLPSLFRGTLLPLGAPLIPALLQRRWLVAEAIRWLSQLRVAYLHSAVSVEGTPRLHTTWPPVGHRLPDATVFVDGRPTRLHALLADPALHLLLQQDAGDLALLVSCPHVRVHRLSGTPGTGVVAVRPDGYVGYRCGIADSAQVRAWLKHVGAE